MLLGRREADSGKYQGGHMTFRSFLYRLARIIGDFQAASRGRIGRRIGRRAAGKVTGRLLGKLFK